jgi:Helix-turn-helix domain
MNAKSSARQAHARETLQGVFSAEVVDAIERVVAERVHRELADRHEFEWVTLDRAGELLGISADGVYRKITKGTLDARKFDGRWFVNLAELDRVIRSGAPGAG